MNISSEISPTDQSNSSSYTIFNATVDIHLYEYTWIYATSVLLGLPTNFYVIWLIVTGNGLATEFFSLNLFVSEILLSLNSLLNLLNKEFEIHKIVGAFLIGLAITGRPLFQCLICVERYLAVVHPVTFLKFKPLRYRVICSGIVWVTTVGSCLVIIMALELFLSKLFVGFILAQFFALLSVQLFCCLAVLRALKQSGPGERGREKLEENHMKRRASNLILTITVTMVIIYAPCSITTILSFTSTQNIDILLSLSEACFTLAGLMLPVLFLLRVGKLPFIKRQ
ncbi:chemokine XC receptor 1-like [Myxocyprinus asiaticus]|uniref:chemokine XC receptor 1-like n=1 Tax=Myxocyprinus asiaticus TaxID=70543 RepID=UPI0022227378|nr:chemokine XC receptor 1-like [Myxocyprinus asiaticus]